MIEEFTTPEETVTLHFTPLQMMQLMEHSINDLLLKAPCTVKDVRYKKEGQKEIFIVVAAMKPVLDGLEETDNVQPGFEGEPDPAEES